MDFVNRNLSGVFKAILGILAVLIFIRIIPLLFLVAIVGLGGFKIYRCFKTWKNRNVSKKEEVHAQSTVYNEESFFDLKDKNVVDVEYEDIRK